MTTISADIICLPKTIGTENNAKNTDNPQNTIIRKKTDNKGYGLRLGTRRGLITKKQETRHNKLISK